LRIHVHDDPELFQHLHLTLLALLPVLVNEDNPNKEHQAAILDVSSCNLSDKESLTLTAHPRTSKYELFKAWRSNEEKIYSTTNLLKMLEFLRKNYPHWLT
jgi:hypothetical protein